MYMYGVYICMYVHVYNTYTSVVLVLQIPPVFSTELFTKAVLVSISSSTLSVLQFWFLLFIVVDILILLATM